MCPLYPYHHLVSYLFFICIALALSGISVVGAISQLKSTLSLNSTLITGIEIKEEESQIIDFYIEGIPDDFNGELKLKISSADDLDHILIAPGNYFINNNSTTSTKPEDLAQLLQTENNTNSSVSSGHYYQNKFNVTGNFIGFSKVKFSLSDGTNEKDMMETESVPVKVQKGNHVLDKVFVHVVIILVIVVYINMGCTIDLTVIGQTLRRPVAPLIGLAAQFLFMPICAYGLGYFFLYDSPSLWLGLFVTGCSPGGGGSNMWTYLLGGSLDLSVTMTFISTGAAFAMMPFWIWLLGDSIYSGGEFDNPPFRNIGMLLVGLIIPLAMGIAIKKWLPKVALVLKKLLKPVALFFIIFVMTFGIYAYWFIFKFFTWRVAICGLGLPWLGFTAGLCIAIFTGRSSSEVIAISIETGLQNTGLAIGLLKVSLKSFAPIGDIAMVVPIAVATLTPLPLVFAYCFKCYKYRGSVRDKSDFVNLNNANSITTIAS